MLDYVANLPLIVIPSNQGLNFLFGFHAGEQRAFRNVLSEFSTQRGYGSSEWCEKRVLHLHGLDDEEPLTSGDCIANRHVDRRDDAGHG